MIKQQGCNLVVLFSLSVVLNKISAFLFNTVAILNVFANYAAEIFGESSFHRTGS